VAPDDAGVLANAAVALAYFGEDIDAMITLVDRALALNPSFARGWHTSGVLRIWAGPTDIAIEHIETSLRLNRRGVAVSLARCLLCPYRTVRRSARCHPAVALHHSCRGTGRELFAEPRAPRAAPVGPTLCRRRGHMNRTHWRARHRKGRLPKSRGVPGEFPWGRNVRGMASEFRSEIDW
jgi:hypothetical protein